MTSRPQDPRYPKRRAVLIRRGQWHPFTDPAPAREHVQKLMTAGISRRQISLRSGVSESLLCRLLYGRDGPGRPPVERIRPWLAAAILAVTADPDRAAGPVLAAGTAATRRLQALTCIGWSPRELADHLQMDTGAVRKIRDGQRQRVAASTGQAIATLYDELWDQPPPERSKPQRIAAAKARAYSRRHGWAPPAAWDDETIADASAEPASGWQRTRHTRRATEVAEDAAELLAQGYSTEVIAHRLGMTAAALEQTLYRARKTAAGQSKAA